MVHEILPPKLASAGVIAAFPVVTLVGADKHFWRRCRERHRLKYIDKVMNKIEIGIRLLKRPLIREDLKVIHYQSQEADNTFITPDGTSPYTSTRKWAVKRHYREGNN